MGILKEFNERNRLTSTVMSTGGRLMQAERDRNASCEVASLASLVPSFVLNRDDALDTLRGRI
jgi:hypothetical protein